MEALIQYTHAPAEVEEALVHVDTLQLQHVGPQRQQLSLRVRRRQALRVNRLRLVHRRQRFLVQLTGRSQDWDSAGMETAKCC